MTVVESPRRVFPPFEKTLAGPGSVPDGAELGATIGREGLAETMAASHAAVVVRALPTVSLDLGTERPAGMRESSTDLVVVGKLGEGGMGVVHLAEQRSLDRLVAVKTTRPDGGDSADAALCEEAIVTGRLEHPNVVPVHAFGRTTDGRAAMVMKRIEGVEWRSLLADPDHPNWAEIGSGDRLVDHLQILAQIANAIAYAHSRGIVHRDVKPENVLVGNYGEVMLVDFGVAARLDGTDAAETRIVGTPLYMAPEMVEGTRPDERTDVYLLGASLHEILTGQPPHAGETLVEVLSCAYLSAPKTFEGEIPVELAEICQRALARDPADRHPTARAFRHALVEFVAHRGSHRLARRAVERRLDARKAPNLAARRAALSESRFAARQAVDQWSGNAFAQGVLLEATLDAIEVELDERNAVGARALVGTLSPPPAALISRLESLESVLADERLGSERFRAMQHDLDASVGASERSELAFVLIAVVLIVGAIVSRYTDFLTLRPIAFVRAGAGMVVLMTLLLGWFWRRSSWNAVGRRILLIGWSSSAMLLTHRLVAYFVDEKPAGILATDSLLFAAMLVVAGITIDTKVLLAVPFPVLGAFVSAAFPAHAPTAFVASTCAFLVAAALYFRRLSRKGRT